MTKATLAQADRWLLAVRVPFNIKEDAKEARLVVRPIAASMIKAYDAEVFCEASREAVSATLKFFREPDIRERLDAWISINIAAPFALPLEAEEAPVSREAKWWLAHWFRADSDAKAERALDLIRDKSEEAFGYLMKASMRAAEIAVWRKWPVPGQRYDWTEAEVREAAHKAVSLRGGQTRLAHCLASTALMALAHSIKINAPQHQDALLDELRWIAAGQPTEAAKPVPVAFVRAPEPVDVSISLFE
jgi:hypothetical protein